MQLYDANINLGRPELAPARPHKIAKVDLTAPEILILRYKHGLEGVTDVVEKEMDKRPHAEELTRLVNLYGAESVQAVFGPLGNVSLPVKLGRAALEPQEA